MDVVKIDGDREVCSIVEDLVHRLVKRVVGLGDFSEENKIWIDF